MDIKFVIPTEEYSADVMSYKAEFIENGDSMDGTAGLANKDFDVWLKDLRDNSCEDTVHEGLVPATTFLVYDKTTLVGMIDIRHRLNEHLKNFGGHIGYSVRKSQRRKGYATQMLKNALEHCRRIGIEKCLVTCNKNNIGSAKTIIKNGGVLENEVAENGNLVQRYWIQL